MPFKPFHRKRSVFPLLRAPSEVRRRIVYFIVPAEARLVLLRKGWFIAESEPRKAGQINKQLREEFYSILFNESFGTKITLHLREGTSLSQPSTFLVPQVQDQVTELVIDASYPEYLNTPIDMSMTSLPALQTLILE